jgi:DNA-binding NtrC family response regulator
VRLTQAIRSACARGDGEAPAILHLDDDRDTLAVTAAALGAEARILSARSIEEAHAILAAESVALAIIDLHLEGASGLDLLPALVDARGVAIPTILYSGQRIGVEAAGKVDAVLVKAPGSLPDLKATIHRMLQRAEAPSEALS